MIKQLIKLANHLDKKGLTKEADYLDAVIHKISLDGSGFGRPNYSRKPGKDDAEFLEMAADMTPFLGQALNLQEHKKTLQDAYNKFMNAEEEKSKSSTTNERKVQLINEQQEAILSAGPFVVGLLPGSKVVKKVIEKAPLPPDAFAKMKKFVEKQGPSFAKNVENKANQFAQGPDFKKVSPKEKFRKKGPQTPQKDPKFDKRPAASEPGPDFGKRKQTEAPQSTEQGPNFGKRKPNSSKDPRFDKGSRKRLEEEFRGQELQNLDPVIQQGQPGYEEQMKRLFRDR